MFGMKFHVVKFIYFSHSLMAIDSPLRYTLCPAHLIKTVGKRGTNLGKWPFEWALRLRRAGPAGIWHP